MPLVRLEKERSKDTRRPIRIKPGQYYSTCQYCGLDLPLVKRKWSDVEAGHRYNELIFTPHDDTGRRPNHAQLTPCRGSHAVPTGFVFFMPEES